ncbi:MAG TPA: cytochrome P450 [Solirubrobacteraceae bacterium]|nr:cytochrome P450 [Solirubrobacteraceae bacterium]
MATAVASDHETLGSPVVAYDGRQLPPGPRVPAFLQTLAWSFAPTWVMDRCAARFGETFTLTFSPSGRQMVVVSDPEAVKTIFTAPPEVAPSATGATPIAPIMGPSSVLTLTGPEHLRQRKLLLPPFHGERMREYEEVIVEATERDMASWPLGEPMRLSERTRAITLDVILRAVFGVEGQDMEAMREAIAGLLAPMGMARMVRLALRNPTVERPDGAIGRGLDHLDAVIYDELRRRRAESDLEERSDILSLLLLARDEDDQAMTDEELRDELVTLLLAGHETTATAVSWAIERLVRHPQKLARLTAEIDAGVGDDYLQAVVSETLRVRPVVPLVIRSLTEPLRVGGHELPAGTRVVPSIHLTNRNPRVYEAPAEFRPERFLEHPPETFSWIPFGGGIRRCIGASFATLEMKLMLRTVLGELQPSLPANDRRTLRGRLYARGEWNQRRAITLVPAAGARVVWRRRSPGRSKG